MSTADYAPPNHGTLPTDAIAAIARARTAGLVAVPWGGPARRLLDERFAVLVGDEDHPWDGRLGVAYDGSRAAEAALAFVRELAEHPDGHVSSVDVAYVDCGGEDIGVLDSRREAMFEWWLRERVGDLPSPVHPVRAIGDPAVALAEFSETVDLLVIGTTRRNRFLRALSPSLTDQLVATSRCPLLVVPA
ncbi:MAG TPA: universal stress protein [Solirubrobacter sp.]|nr:universal stress protein [Solirubrobacter sp.]